MTPTINAHKRKGLILKLMIIIFKTSSATLARTHSSHNKKNLWTGPLRRDDADLPMKRSQPAWRVEYERGNIIQTFQASSQLVPLKLTSPMSFMNSEPPLPAHRILDIAPFIIYIHQTQRRSPRFFNNICRTVSYMYVRKHMYHSWQSIG